MTVLARADAAAIQHHLARAPALPAWVRLRGPETGLVMVRGRQGGDGAPFNLGEMTVTRCTIRIDDPADDPQDRAALVGHAYVAGRDPRHAELAAVLDGLLQDPRRAEPYLLGVLAPLEAAQHARAATLARQAAATRVRFDALATMR